MITKASFRRVPRPPVPSRLLSFRLRLRWFHQNFRTSFLKPDQAASIRPVVRTVSLFSNLVLLGQSLSHGPSSCEAAALIQTCQLSPNLLNWSVFSPNSRSSSAQHSEQQRLLQSWTPSQNVAFVALHNRHAAVPRLVGSSWWSFRPSKHKHLKNPTEPEPAELTSPSPVHP